MQRRRRRVRFDDRVRRVDPDTLAVNRQTWAYDLDSNTWARMHPKESPFARFSYAMGCRLRRGTKRMVYDPDADLMILFGGSVDHETVAFQDTWTYDDDEDVWARSLVEGSSARAWHTMALAAIAESLVAGGPIVLWSSTDGTRWEPVADPGNTADFVPEASLTTGRDGSAAFVALPVIPSGAEGVAQPMLSADGTTWEAIPQGPDVGDGLCRTGSGHGGGHPVGDAVFVTSGCDKTGHRILWVGRLTGR